MPTNGRPKTQSKGHDTRRGSTNRQICTSGLCIRLVSPHEAKPKQTKLFPWLLRKYLNSAIDLHEFNARAVRAVDRRTTITMQQIPYIVYSYSHSSARRSSSLSPSLSSSSSMQFLRFHATPTSVTPSAGSMK